MNFNQAVKIVLEIEKGYVNNPNDPGGETNFGISKKSYPLLDIKNLTRDQAIEIYKRDFWDQYKIEMLPSPLRLFIFDSAVIMGGQTSIGLLQAAIGVKVDGFLGPLSIEKLAQLDMAAVLRKYAFFRWRNHSESKKFVYFASGWGTRLIDISILCALELEAPSDRILT